MHVNRVTVALAAKIAQTAWVVITKPGALYERRDPAVACRGGRRVNEARSSK